MYLSLKEVVLKKNDSGMAMARGSLMLWEPKVSKAKTKQTKPARQRESFSFTLFLTFVILNSAGLWSVFLPRRLDFYCFIVLAALWKEVQTIPPQNPCTQKMDHHPAYCVT